jgi:hypothetical protein
MLGWESAVYRKSASGHVTLTLMFLLPVDSTGDVVHSGASGA